MNRVSAFHFSCKNGSLRLQKADTEETFWTQPVASLQAQQTAFFTHNEQENAWLLRLFLFMQSGQK